MKYKVISLSVIVAIASIGGLFFANFDNEKVSDDLTTEYIPSDMSKYFPNHEITYVHSSYGSTDVKELKEDVKYSVQGTVVDISDVQYWDGIDKNLESFADIDLQTIKVEVDIEVDQVGKSTKDIKKGDIITVTIQGMKQGNQISFISSDQYEIGEEVIVHLGEDPNDIVGDDVKFSIAGEHTKYKVQKDKAFNEDNKKGKLTKDVLGEAR